MNFLRPSVAALAAALALPSASLAQSGSAGLVIRAENPLAMQRSAEATARPGVPTVQFMGAGWTASGDFRSVEDWWRHLDVFGQRLANPVKISLWSYGKAIPAGE